MSVERVAICREAGGLGDVLRAVAPATVLAERGCEVDAFILRGYEYYASRVQGVRRAWPVTGKGRRDRDQPFDVKAQEYLRYGGIRDR